MSDLAKQALPEKKLSIPDYDAWILKQVQGVFGQVDMSVMRAECQKLKSGDIYLEIGVNEGRSFAVASHYAPKGVYIIGIDIIDVPPHEFSIGRAPFMQDTFVGINKRGFYIHGDADEFSYLWKKKIKLMFIDGHHDYDSVKANTLKWENKVEKGGVILFHDYDHPETKRWLDEHYGDKKEVLHGKIVKVVK